MGALVAEPRVCVMTTRAQCQATFRREGRMIRPMGHMAIQAISTVEGCMHYVVGQFRALRLVATHAEIFDGASDKTLARIAVSAMAHRAVFTRGQVRDGFRDVIPRVIVAFDAQNHG